jgi:hypothetical protein
MLLLQRFYVRVLSVVNQEVDGTNRQLVAV